MPIRWQQGDFGQLEQNIAAAVLPGQLLIAGRSQAFAYLFAFAAFSVAPAALLGAATNRRELLGLLSEASSELYVLLHDDLLERHRSTLLEQIRSARPHGAGIICLASLEATVVAACTGTLAADAVIAEQNIGKGCLIPAIEAIRTGTSPYVDPLLQTIYTQEIQGRRDVKPRERDILMLVAAGLTNKEIAAALFIAETTTRDYISALMQRFDAANRAALAALAVELGYGQAITCR